MRMWLVDPTIMCRKHLLGEHLELHMFIGILRKRVSIKGYIQHDLLEPSSIFIRHIELVAEMFARGYKHNSPITDDMSQLLEYLSEEEREHRIDRESSYTRLLTSCYICRGYTRLYGG